ncbi:DNA methyltransferase [Acidovorax sp. Leaf84]|uniref:DNA-methyltransferase n=1 Tax=Acidovorax sp. Leaf84 TaxID=1736240 RepID=UPI0006F27EC1|nr:site-specific DNA-methyltransferase [Acidovorax sp. Leaf84]KQO38052.1 DNA methyltransferase [Acidovorax sp. Leaf84]
MQSHDNSWLNRCHFGDVRAVLRQMIADGVQVDTIVTSPPYWGLRSYLPAEHPDKQYEIGSEPTLAEFLAGMVEVFDLARQVLKPEGTAWVNMGDSYAGSWGSQGRDYGGIGVSAMSARQVAASQRKASGTGTIRDRGIKPKDLMGQPWRLAFALQDAGWWLRQDIIWHKPNPMPESIKDRCTKAHEYLFLLAKSERYYFDQASIRTPLSPETKALSFETMDYKARDRYKTPAGWATHGSKDAADWATPEMQGRRGNGVGWGYADGEPKERTKGSKRNSFARETKNTAGEHGQKAQHRPDRDEVHYSTTANKRSVWTVPTEAYPGSHFATFPRALIEPCILAGAPPGGVVLDIFFGSGTTGQVAQQLGRQFIGIDLNRANDPLQRDRLRQPSLTL